MDAALSIQHLTKTFTDPSNPRDTVTAVDDVSLDVAQGEFLTMVGPSGCGKSTILRLISGLDQPTGGDIHLHGRNVSNVRTPYRNIGFMFQGYALFRHMTVAENIAFGLKLKRVPKDERRRRVDELIQLMGLDGLAARRPAQISGGQQQRVALARCLASKPGLLLLDEPFGAVDAKVRLQLRTDTKRLQRELGITTILVTHDQREALELGDRVAVMRMGRIEQVDVPRTIYDNPATEFAARFIGRANVVSTSLDEPHEGLPKGTPLTVIVRPEDIVVDHAQPHGLQRNGSGLELEGIIGNYAFLGRTVRLEVELPNGIWLTAAMPKNEALAKGLTHGEQVTLGIRAYKAFVS